VPKPQEYPALAYRRGIRILFRGAYNRWKKLAGAGFVLIGLLVLAGCTVPFLGIGGEPVPLPGTPELAGLAFGTSTLVGTPSPLPSATGTPTRTPDPRWTPLRMPSPTFSPYRWTCIPDGSPDPCHRVFRDIAMLPEGGWVVGERGVILRRTDGAWETVPSPVDLTLRLVRVVSADDAWAVADEMLQVQTDQTRSHNVFLHWDGAAWTVFENPIQFERVVDLSFVSGDNGWGIVLDESVGPQATALIRWNGVEWTPELREDGMNALQMLNTAAGWVAGDGGLILHWNGYRWHTVEAPLIKDYDGVAFAGEDAGWMTSSEGAILRANNLEWNLYSGLAPHPRRMVLDPDGNGWIFGSWIRGDVVLTWTGEWEIYKGIVPDGEVLGLAAPASDDYWAAGWVPGRARSGMIWRGDTAGWRRDFSAGPLPVTAAAFPADDDGWAVGEDGLIAHWNGAAWSETDSPTEQTLNAVAFSTAEDGWAAGEGGQILHWDGSTWSVFREFRWRRAGDGATFNRIDALAFPSADDGWAAGSAEGGATLQPWMLHWNGLEWEEAPLFAEEPPCLCSLTALDFLTATDGWAVGGGERAVILHWDGTAWTSALGPEGYRLLAVHATAADDAWAAGVADWADEIQPHGVILHWDGTRWQEVPAAESVGRMDAIAFTADGDGWMAGQNLLHWDGSAWGTAWSPVDAVIVALADSQSGGLLGVTETGAVLRLAGN
jgi:hypothetical protein